MSHPLIVDAAENCFIPLCIYNNTKGDGDASVRKAFNEPSWNNPVVRIIDSQKKDIIPRIAEKWTLHALATGLAQALEKSKKEAPPYLTLLSAEASSRARGVEAAVFGMG